MSNARGREQRGVCSRSIAPISVLEILAQRGEAGVSEVAADIGVHKSTAFRLLGALEARGLVEQTQDRGKYRLGFGILRLASAVPGRLDVTHQARPICERLAASSAKRSTSRFCDRTTSSTSIRRAARGDRRAQLGR